MELMTDEPGFRRTLSLRRATTLETVALHEAGHAVAAWAQGWSVLALSIEPSEFEGRIANGRIEFERPCHPAGVRDRRIDRQVMIEEIVIHLAGAVGEHTANAAVSGSVSAGRDFRLVESYMVLLTGSAEEEVALWQHLWHRAENLLLDNWPLVESTAAALLTNNSLTGTEFAAIAAAVVEREKRLRAEYRAAAAEMGIGANDDPAADRRSEVRRLLPAHIRLALDWEDPRHVGPAN